jgi:ABC-type branched-subunit amino acid transport system substrate-binding protein
MSMKLAKCSVLLSFLMICTGSMAENGVTDREILIGQFAAFSGPSAQLGQRLQVGIQAYFNAVNAQGGVNGHTLRLVTRDDGYEPDKAAAAVKALIKEDKVFALIGAVGTPTGLAAMPIFTEEKVPMIGMFTGAQGLREPFNRYVFHVRASYFDETERIVQHLTTLGVTKMAVFYQNDAYGKAGLEGVTRALTKRQLKPAATATFERNTVDVGAALTTILAAQPEAIVQIGAYKACAVFIRDARQKGYGGQFFNVSFVGAKALADELGPAGMGVVISQVVPFPYTPSALVVREYQQRMTEAGQKEFDFSSMEGFLTAKVLVEGLRRVNKPLTRDALMAALESMKDVNLGGFTITFGPKDHEGSRYTDLTIIGRDGRFVH